MSDFTFTATARCDVCGQYLSSSNEDCDHNGVTAEKHVFRQMGNGRESLVGVRATPKWKWYQLEEIVGDDWIKYEYLGSKDTVNNLLNSSTWDSVEDLPKVSMSLDAPSDVGEE